MKQAAAIAGLLAACSLPSLAQRKPQEKYPLVLYVAGAASEEYAAGRTPDRPATPAVTKCSGAFDVTCETTLGTPAKPSEPIINVQVFLSGATINGSPRVVGCRAQWVGSKCAQLSPGSYRARWKNGKQKQLRVLVHRAGGRKDEEVTFDVH